MFTRRLIVLFGLVVLAGSAILLRLAQLQLAEAEQWQAKGRLFVNRHYIMDTVRGSILDRKGVLLAVDTPCYDLAIDYRAMNHDDRWITAEAVKRLKKAGVADRRERLRRLADEKARVVADINAIPAAISRALAPGLGRDPTDLTNDIEARKDAIRARIVALRQNLWSRTYRDRGADAAAIAAGAFDREVDLEIRDERAYHTLVAAVPNEIAFEFAQQIERFPGLSLVDATRRVYPCGDVAAHLIGTLRPIARTDLEHDAALLRDPARAERENNRPLLAKFERPDLLEGDDPGDLKGYLPGDSLGASGVEAIAEDLLRGSRGVRLVQLSGEEVLAKRKSDLPGQNVRLTLDIKLQAELQQIILDPTRNLRRAQDQADNDPTQHDVVVLVLSLDGQILVALSTPTFNLNTYPQDRAKLMADQAHLPLLNRALAAAYPPGSTIKAMVAAAILNSGLATPTESVNCIGRLYPRDHDHFRCNSIHNTVHLTSALEQSCNVYFYTMGARLGLPELARWYRLFGFGEHTGIGLLEDVDGGLVNPARVTESDRARAKATMMAIGQDEIAVTPLQIAQAYATLLRGGTVIPPRIALDAAPGPARSAFTITPEHLRTIRQGLELVVSGDHGTARKTLRHLPIAGKTGSADDHQPAFTAEGQPVPDLQAPWRGSGVKVLGPDGQYYRQAKNYGTDAWFVGYTPVEAPQFVIVTFMEFGGHGGAAATPLAKETLLVLQRHGYLPETP